MTSAEEVTITPVDRPNSPPTISSATGVAMIPMVEEAYSTLLKVHGTGRGQRRTSSWNSKE